MNLSEALQRDPRYYATLVGYDADATAFVSLEDVVLKGKKVRNRRRLTSEDWQRLILANHRVLIVAYGPTWNHYSFGGHTVYYDEAIKEIENGSELGLRIMSRSREHYDLLFWDLDEILGTNWEYPY